MESDDTEPEVEPLEFDIDQEVVPPDVKQVMVGIKSVAEKLLYRWKSFPVVLPPSVTEAQRTENETQDEDGVISFNDLFIAPAFDELEEVARDENGRSKILNDEQMLSIRKTGEFDVNSKNFPNQVHRWRLSLLLQKGTDRAKDTILNLGGFYLPQDMALALRLIIVTARNRFHSHFFSLSQSLQGIKHGLWQILDILIGMPSTTPGSLYEKLHEEHSRFLVAELHVKPSCRQEWANFCDYIKDSIKLEKDTSREVLTRDVSPPPVPYRFMTAKGSDIDFRLFNRDLMQRCTMVLKKILEKESKGWYVKYKDQLITELKGQDLSKEEISQHVNKAIKEEYLRRVFQSVNNSQELENLQPNIGKLLVDQATSALIMEKSLETVREKLYYHQQEHEHLLVNNYPVRSRIKAWRNERLQEFEEEFIEQNQWVAHEDSLAECRRNSLEQSVYFLHRDLLFLRDREPVLRKELGKVKLPNRIYTFQTRIWRPRNWVISQHMYEGSEIIPTVITDTPITDSQRRVVHGLYYSAHKYILRKTSTHYPFWRWVNYFFRTVSWTWNAMFGLGVVVPWYSSISLRALTSPRPFIANLAINQSNGSLCPDGNSLTPTLVSRLRDLWAHVRVSREKFEAEPDTGFLGKSCTRHLNRLWNFVLKGAFGSAALVLLMVPLCLGGSLISMTMALTAPFWMPAVTLCGHFISVLFYDFDHPSGNAIMYLFEAVLFRLFIQGVIQPICALITALIFLPTAAAFVLLAGLVKRGGRAAWDAFMFYAVIKKRGRVPSQDGFIARRIEGPGLASNYFFQVKPAQALAAVEARVELHEVKAWSHSMAQTIQKPLEEYRRFVQGCFGPFSGTLEHNGVYERLDKEIQVILQDLHNACDGRKKNLNTGLNDDIRNRIKLSARELKVTIAQTAKMLESFYPEHIIDRLPQSEDEFWESRHLEQNDWQGLATQLLTEIFSSSFLTPLEDTDNCFKLQVEHLYLSRYLEMLKSAEFRDDLDVVNTVHTPKGDIDVDAPYIELYLFSPRKEKVNYESTFLSGIRRRARMKPWKKQAILFKEIEKLEIPLPITHPTVICALIYNRDNDLEPIDLEDEMCQNIFRTAEQLIYVEPPNRNGHDMYETEASTPDHGTNSEPDMPLSHLAEQESSAFSDDNLRSMSPDSMPDPVVMEPAVPDTMPLETDAMVAMVIADAEEDSDSDQVGSRVMYSENEANTSCILQMEDEDGEEQDLALEETEDVGSKMGDVQLKLVPTPGHSSDDSDEEHDADFDDAEDFSEGINKIFDRMLHSPSGSLKRDSF